MIESYVSAVAVADCDEMGHMNIQHYAAAAQAATDVLAAGSARTPLPHWMHLRFHREMRPGDQIRVLSARTGGATPDRLVHCIENAGTGLLCATALCAYASAPDTPVPDAPAPYAPAPYAPVSDVPHAAAPRTLTHDVPPAPPARPAGMVRTHLAAITPDDCRAGAMTLPAFLRRVSRCQAHLWALAGHDRRSQAQADRGTASLELRAVRFAPAPPGRPLEIVTGFTPPTGKVLHYRHLGFDAATGACFFLAEGVGVMIDLKTRRAVTPPRAPASSDPEPNDPVPNGPEPNDPETSA